MKIEEENETVLSGEVCFVSFRVQTDELYEMESKDFRYPWRIFEESNIDLRKRLESIVKETLGEQFQLKSLTVGRGSIEVIANVATTYYAVSKYKNFVESIDLMVQQCKSLISKYFGDRIKCKTVVTANWVAAPSLSKLQASNQPIVEKTKNNEMSIVTKYLVFSHFILTAAILFILLEKHLP